MNALNKRGLALTVSFAVAALAAGCGGSDGAPTSAAPQPTALQTCDALAGKTIGGATVTSTGLVPQAGAVPTYCRVSARIEPALNFEMRVPDSWNGKLHYEGGGGLNGVITPVEKTDGPILTALSSGFITVTSDSGHQGSPYDASWAVGNPQAELLYGSLSVPTVMASTVEIIKTAYGKEPSRSYFDGCSNGGREGLMAAERYPNLFDGIIARAPAINFVGFVGAWQRNAKALAAPGGNFTPAKIALFSNAVLSACDANDGVTDGLVSNPAACKFDPQVLRCVGGTDTGDACLSDAQLGVLASVTGPASFAGGAYKNIGWPLTGNESAPGNWDAWLTGSTPVQNLFMTTSIRSFITRDLSLNALTYDYNSNPAALERMSEILDATNTDLRPFKYRGGKLILWHGGSDSALSYKNTEAWLNGVAAAVGGNTNADAFTRFYVAPGVHHCSGGPGADKTNLLAALDSWVEKGTAPGTLTAAKLAADGSTSFTRPLCVQPMYPRYVGPAGDAGAAKLAANYTCVAP